MTTEQQKALDRMILEEDIQRTHNRIQYDRTIDETHRQQLRHKLHSLEVDREEFFGREGE